MREDFIFNRYTNYVPPNNRVFLSFHYQNRGFPSPISTRAELYKVLLNIIWVNSVHHTVLNYPVKEFGSYIPFISYTLYKKPSDWHPSEIENITAANSDGLVKMFPTIQKAIVGTHVTGNYSFACIIYNDR